MTVYLSPASGVNLLRSSLGSLYPIQDYNGGDRLTYFIYYSHGSDDVGPWELSLHLVVSNKLLLRQIFQLQPPFLLSDRSLFPSSSDYPLKL